MQNNIIYTTAEIAEIIGIHPNTVRKYEEWGLIAKPDRGKNGYRIFTDAHIGQFRIARLLLRAEVIHNGLRRQALAIIKAAACNDYVIAEKLAHDYCSMIERELNNAREALRGAEILLKNSDKFICQKNITIGRVNAAKILGVTAGALRNWERNCLFEVTSGKNGYKNYSENDFRILLIIRTLRLAGYSHDAILRMMSAFRRDTESNLEQAIDTPNVGETIISVCDKLLTSLKHLTTDAEEVKDMLKKHKSTL